jgi:hypothetical protein
MTNQSNRIHDIFIAHAGDVKDFGRKLSARLTAAGFRVFFDERELNAGEPYDPAIEDSVKACRVFLFVVSAKAVAPGAYALTELEWAIRSRRPLLAVHADGHDQISPPPDLAALTYITSRGDRIAQTVAKIRETLNSTRIGPAWFWRIPRIVRWTLASGSAVWLIYALMRKPPFGGSIYDKRNQPLSGVTLTFLGAGPVTECPPVQTDKSGGFLFDKCRTAERAQNPRVIVHPPGRPPCPTEVSLQRPPSLTLIRIDPTEDSCTPSSDITACVGCGAGDAGIQDAGLPERSDASLSCQQRVLDAVAAAGARNGLELVGLLKTSDDAFEGRLVPKARTEGLTGRVSIGLTEFEAQCILFSERYRNDDQKKSQLRKFLMEISLDPNLVEVESMRKLGFTTDDAMHLREHLSRLLQSPRIFRDDQRYRGVSYIEVKYSKRGSPAFIAVAKAQVELSAAQEGVVRDIRRVGVAAASCP